MTVSNVPVGNEPVSALPYSPAYSEQDVKATLDSCRLTYVYEPDWTRLRRRVSQILSGGMLVAWFQGAAGVGASVAGRTIICDPSNRWARENVNRFLRQVPIESPLPLVTTSAQAHWHEGQVRTSPQRVTVVSEWRNQLVGAIDRAGCVQLQEITESDDRRLFELIGEHRSRTGVPALIAVPFCASSQAVVCSPLDAIGTMFSSPVDVLVIERFALAKDYWLLGAHG